MEKADVPERRGSDILVVQRHLGRRVQKHTTENCHLKLQAPKHLVTRVCQEKQDRGSYKHSGLRGASDSMQPILAGGWDGWC